MTEFSTRAQCAPGNAALRAMFAARKRVFIDLLKWDLPALAGEYEIDQFDTADAHYLILLGADGEHRASARLLPSVGTHLLGGLYAHLCDRSVPRGPTIYEISRFCLDRDQDAAARLAARNQLVTALAEHALREGITHYTGVAEEGWFRQIMKFGWRCEALGGAIDDRRARLVGLCIHIDDRTLDGLKRAGVYAPLSLRLAESGEMIA
ncbi:N-acyl-L-homoserine lactone synthetase [Novosphingobium resinovorum]|uniref:Acyl-homoserine-lactone synthase n=1 Tax=Novosphingobium resinovorum TaxID=158500 RepID=A0A031K5V8_9SPHN|nr:MULTISPECIES: acyl-homoserine-lactone synthase [Novosphingobium]EZP83992.1 N-acyl-L-homoserine lactone synthetase [Novosphingobium resinovorum]